MGCVRGTDPWDQQPPVHVEWQEYELEPFTQTRMVSGLREADATFNTSLILPGNGCTQQHLGLVVEAHSNFTGEMVFGLVTGARSRAFPPSSPLPLRPRLKPSVRPRASAGKLEEFTLDELLSFTLFILRNHGAQWTNLPWTLPLIAVFIPVIDLVAAVATWYAPRKWVPSIVNVPCTARSLLLQVASWAFLVAATEIFVHLVIAQVGAEFGYGFWVALLLIVGLANLVPWLLTVAIWRAHIYEQGCYSSPWWAVPECALGFGGLILVASGFLVGPVCLILDATVRITELVPKAARELPEDQRALGAVREL